MSRQYVSVSIQLPLGGHSFSEEQLLTLIKGVNPREVEVVLPTLRLALIPFNQCSANPADHLRNVGRPMLSSETLVADCTEQGITAFMAVDAECHALLCRHLGDCVRYRTPLFLAPAVERGVVLLLVDGLLYVRLYDQSQLLFADVYEANNDADILYILSMIDHTYNIYSMDLSIDSRIEGNPRRLLRLCKPLFKSCKCV